jgi:S-adenosylmethionine:tRNA ribosyltransferase-isomerase
LIYQDFVIKSDSFSHLPDRLEDDGLILFNETKVVQARLNFLKETGANIEIFCLEPISPSSEIQEAYIQTGPVVWKCLIGNSKKWKSGKLMLKFTLNSQEYILTAERTEKHSEYSLITFEWHPRNITFSEVLQSTGIIPLPPYMTRQTEDLDKERYQTIYARSEGSVAAPTAGLHFTDSILKKIEQKNIGIRKLTLHVGAGTFKPISAKSITDHQMHTEKITIELETIRTLIQKLNSPITLVGTTTLRTIESLYWHGVKCIIEKQHSDNMNIKQWDPYQPCYQKNISPAEALDYVVRGMEKTGIDRLHGQTQLMIVPGYRFQIPNALVTNFHMPRSTLLLLVAAFVGAPWKQIYQYALQNNYRFLSYGDSCLFFRH